MIYALGYNKSQYLCETNNKDKVGNNYRFDFQVSEF